MIFWKCWYIYMNINLSCSQSSQVLELLNFNIKDNIIVHDNKFWKHGANELLWFENYRN